MTLRQWLKATATRLLVKAFSRQIVNELYAGVLQRSPDEEGLSYYSAQLKEGLTPAAILKELVSSREHWKIQVKHNSEEIIGIVYQALLGRRADTEGVTRYSQLLGNDQGLKITLDEITSSAEFRRFVFYSKEVGEAIVDSVYLAVLKRKGDEGGLATYAKRLQHPRDVGPLVASLIDSEEFRTANEKQVLDAQSPRTLLGRQIDQIDVLCKRYGAPEAYLNQVRLLISNDQTVWGLHRELLRRSSKQPHELRILIFGAYGNGNLGDVYQALAVEHHLHRQCGIATDNIFACSVLHTSDFPFDPNRKLSHRAIYDVSVVDSFDFVVVGGGGLLAHPHNPLNEAHWARKITTPVLLLGVGASKALVNDHLPLLETVVGVSARDPGSIQALQTVRNDVVHIPDPILSLESGATLTKYDAPIRQFHSNIDVLWILKHPSSPADEVLLSEVERLINSSSKRHVIVAIEPHLDNVLSERFSKQEVLYVDSAVELLHLVRASGLVFSMRYHGIIFAVLENRRVIGASQSKIKELLTDANCGSGYLEDASGLAELRETGGVLVPPSWLELKRRTFGRGMSQLFDLVAKKS